MKRTISLLIVWLVLLHTCGAQTDHVQDDVVYDTVYRYDPSAHKEFGLDISISPNPPMKGSGEIGLLYPTPTLIEMKETGKGEKYARVYVNTDLITIVCHGVTARNQEDYSAYKELTNEQRPARPGFDNQLSIYVDNFGPPTLGPDQINDEKKWLYKRNFHYFIKDKTGKIVSSLIIEFVFPKPEPLLIEINEQQIKERKDRPVETPIYIPGYIENNRKELALANKAAVKTDELSNIPSRLVSKAGIRTVLFQFKALNYRADNFLEYRVGNGEWKTVIQGEKMR